ncbi:putative Flagellin [Candidatus Terasakiella magnetica]|nr:putative Flagellin [Candidatus Terasakiella magnetica]
MSGITLSHSIRDNLLALTKTATQVDTTNQHLSTGKKVSSAVDDAVAYFQAKSLDDRASDLSARKDGIDQGISSLSTALTGITTAESLLNQMKGVVLAAKSASDSDRAALGAQLSSLGVQLNQAANDTSYQGLNLINATASNLKVQFSEKSNAYLQVDGADVRISAGIGMTWTINASQLSSITLANGISSFSVGGAAVAGFSSVSVNVSVFDKLITILDSGISSVRSTAQTLGSNVALLKVRLDFTTDYVNLLTKGAGKLTLADLNEEGANLVSLQTRQQLGTQALSFAGRSEQGVLSLLR